LKQTSWSPKLTGCAGTVGSGAGTIGLMCDELEMVNQKGNDSGSAIHFLMGKLSRSRKVIGPQTVHFNLTLDHQNKPIKNRRAVLSQTRSCNRHDLDRWEMSRSCPGILSSVSTDDILMSSYSAVISFRVIHAQDMSFCARV
jgi:hypothetical protein